VVHEKFIKGVEEFLGQGSERKAHFIGQLVGFDFSSKPDVDAALKEADAFRRVAQGYLGELFTTASKVNPVMLHIEDVHWADDRSLDLINNLVRDNTDLPLFVLCMARPSLYERRPQWGEGQRFHEKIQLEPLSQLSSRRLVRELLKHVPEVPAALRDLVVDRADGNPFYIEELIKALIDDRVILKGEETWSIDTTRLSTVRVPATLTGVLQARLDTLPAQLYQLLQRVSVVGRVFWDAAAVHLGREAAGMKPNEVQAMLEDLRDREMILQREESGFAGTVEFVFRHAILRDVTYETVIPRQRRALHKLVGDWLLEIGGERAGEHTLLVAEHYARAEEAKLAAAQLTQAGERGLLLAAYEEAMTLFDRAHAMLLGPEHTEQRLTVELLRANVESIRGHYEKAKEMMKPALDEVRATGNKRLLANLLGQLGRVVMWQGDFSVSMKYIAEALDLSREIGDNAALVFNLRQMGNMLVQTDPHESQKYALESVDLAQRLGDEESLAQGFNTLGIAYQLGGDPVKSLAAFRRSLEMNRAQGNRMSEAMALGNIAGLYSADGDLETAERMAREGLAIAREIGASSLFPSGEAMLAEICLRAGRDAEARTWAKAAGQSLRGMGIPPTLITVFYGISRVREGDRPKGLAWVGFARAHDPNQAEMKLLIRSFEALLRGDASEEETEAAMRAGEGLELEAILAEAEREAG